MNRKTLILCLAVLAVMIAGVGIAVAVLYSDSGSGDARKESAVPDQGRYRLLPAVPADAVLVACFSDIKDASSGVLSGFGFPQSVSAHIDDFRSLSSASMTVSLHFSGKLHPLYVFDAGRPAAEPSEDASALMALAAEKGMKADFVPDHSFVIVSDSETLLKSSLRHLEKSISVKDASGFAAAASLVSGNDVVFFSNTHAKMLMTEMFTRRYAAHNPFIASLAQWTAVGIAKADASGAYMTAAAVHENDASDFMTVLSKSEPAVSKVAQMLPSYTVSAVSLPMKKVEPYVEAYQAYMDSKQSLQ